MALSDLTEVTNLSGITFLEISAVQDEITDREVSPESDEESLESFHPTFGYRVDPHANDKAFRIRFRMTVESRSGIAVVEIASEWILTEGSARSIDGQTMLDFVNSEGLNTMLPYVRQALADITQRVYGNAVVMPVTRRGEIAFTAHWEEPAAATV